MIKNRMTSLSITQSLLFVTVLWLCGCAVLEKVALVPEASSEISFDTVLINMEVLNIVALALKDANVTNLHTEITYLDVLEGTLETGYFRESNIADMRLHVQIERDNKLIAIVLKGAGPYYSKLPVEESLWQVKEAIICRLAEAVKAKNISHSTPNTEGKCISHR